MSSETETANGGASIVRTGFSETSIERVHETNQASMVAQARAQVEAMFVMARHNPRSWDTVRVKLLNECKRPAFAKAAWFKKPQGGKFIEGLSVRFAETALRLAGNLRRGTRTIFEDDRKRQINVFVVDCETNSESSRDITLDKTVERKNAAGRLVIAQRTNTAGEPVFIVAATDDELMMKEGALISKVGRVLILQMVPGDILDECRTQIVETRNNDDAKDPGAARKALADAFAALSIMPLDLGKYLGHDIGQCTPAELEDLRGIYAAIRDGEASWIDIMTEKTGVSADPSATSSTAEPDKPKSRGQRLARDVKERAAAGAPATTSTTTPAASATASPTPAAAEQPAQPPKGGAATQVEMLGGIATVVDNQVVSITPKPSEGSPVASKEPVIPPATQQVVSDQENARRLAEQATLHNAWKHPVGTPVIVEMAGGKLFETYTKTPSRMFGQLAVINVDGIEGPVALSVVRAIAK
jgi:hypothetical protein